MYAPIYPNIVKMQQAKNSCSVLRHLWHLLQCLLLVTTLFPMGHQIYPFKSVVVTMPTVPPRRYKL